MVLDAEFLETHFPRQRPNPGDPKPPVIKHEGFRFYDFPKSGSSWLSTWEDEENIRKEYWYPNLKDSKLVMDVGADVGSYTLPALAANGPYVITITPENFNELCCNLDLNGWFDSKRCLPMDTAFYDAPGYLEFMRQSFSDRPAGNYYRVWPMDNVIGVHNDVPIDIIKIDVEGAELQVLKGAKNTIAQNQPKLLIECHNFKEPGMDDAVINYLSNTHGIYEYKRSTHNMTVFVYAYMK